MGIARYCFMLVLGFSTFTPFVLAAEEAQTGSVFEDGLSSDEQRARLQARYRKSLGLDDPVYTISLEANSIREYRITSENKVKLVLKQQDKGMEYVVWNASSFEEAREFIQLVKKGAVRSATVRTGRILEILLKDNALQ